VIEVMRVVAGYTVNSSACRAIEQTGFVTFKILKMGMVNDAMVFLIGSINSSKLIGKAALSPFNRTLRGS
jgi:hypothetical protein